MVVANVDEHLASSMAADAQFESSVRGTLIYADLFTRDAIHKCGEASLGFPTRFFLRKKSIIYYPILEPSIMHYSH